MPDPEAIVAGFEAEFEALLALAQETKEMPSTADLLGVLEDALAALDSLLAKGAAGSDSVPMTTPARCRALAKTGRQCKNLTLPGSGFCHMHA
jgi:hypothetical protein